MAKGGGGKLTKLKSVIKKWQSIGKLGRANGSSIAAASPSDDDSDSRDLHPVYVGKSRAALPRWLRRHGAPAVPGAGGTVRRLRHGKRCM
ncbi:hypothetical protein CK203_013447 [Vitis vinifera]|uniref:Uncharacterized protein n=1 Tax=Vitis vinifera TaxID=29760 RepID=A0A438J8Q8_VITVI|nr:hypothetical protein CK203_013447 [Vitis vinifera]